MEKGEARVTQPVSWHTSCYWSSKMLISTPASLHPRTVSEAYTKNKQTNNKKLKSWNSDQRQTVLRRMKQKTAEQKFFFKNNHVIYLTNLIFLALGKVYYYMYPNSLHKPLNWLLPPGDKQLLFSASQNFHMNWSYFCLQGKPYFLSLAALAVPPSAWNTGPAEKPSSSQPRLLIICFYQGYCWAY